MKCVLLVCLVLFVFRCIYLRAAFYSAVCFLRRICFLLLQLRLHDDPNDRPETAIGGPDDYRANFV